MDGFRAILAVVGLVVVVLVYLYTQRQSRHQTAQRIEPTFDGPADALADNVADIAANTDVPPVASLSAEPPEDTPMAGADESGEGAGAEPQPEKIVAIRVVARGTSEWGGEELVLALRGLGLRHGQFNVFHRFDGDETAPVFSVANLTEPGSFELANIREQVFTGVSLFMVLPGQLPGADAFDMMIEAARTLAKGFDADLLDASGSTLSIQRERFMREELIQFEHDRALRLTR